MRKLVLHLFLALCLAGGMTVQAQLTTGDILGTVSDENGAAVVQATVVVENIGTHETRTMQTSSSGDYSFTLLNPGVYSVQVSAPGFKTHEVSSVQLGAGDRIRVNAPLAIGEVSETVTVQATASALQTDSSAIVSTVESAQTQDLPLNGRNFVQLVQLAPGVNEGPPTSLTNGTNLDDHRQSAAMSVNGQSDILNNQMIDGADNNERLIGTIGVRPSVAAISELKVETNSYTADVGRTGGGVVNVITASGTNQFHGSLFEFFRNDLLDTYPYAFGARLPKTELRQNQFGGGLGGPIIRNRTFFFGDYEGYRQVVGMSPVSVTVPTAYEHAHPGDFSDEPTWAQNIATFGPAPLDVAGAAYFGLLPAPNQGLNTYVGTTKMTQNSNDFDVRVDHQFNQTNSVYARFIYNNVLTLAPAGNGGGGILPDAQFGSTGLSINPNIDSYNSRDLAYNGLVNYIHTFSPHLLLELKAGYTLVDNNSVGFNDGKNPNAALGQANVNTPIDNATALQPVLIADTGNIFGDMYFQPLVDRDNTFQYIGSVTYTRGAHTFKFGANLIRRQLTSLQSSLAAGMPLFLSYADLLQGQYLTMAVPRSLELTPPHLRVWETGTYAQDDWHMNKWLSVNLGVRYDLFTPYTEIQNRLSTFDPETGALLVAGRNGVSSSAGVQTDFRGIQPRIGFAATVRDGFVVRGGFGMSYMPSNITSNANMKNVPFVSAVNCSFMTCGLYSIGLPAITASSINDPNVSIGDAVDPKFRTSYFEQYNLTLQKDWSGNVATISYIGSVGRQLAQLLPDLNEPGPNACGSDSNCYGPLRPYYSIHPNLTVVGFFKTGGKSSYNAFQASYERRLQRGLSVNANYSWAHNLDNATGFNGGGQGGGYGQNPSQVSKVDYGNSLLDIRHRFAVSALYQLPFGRRSSGLTALTLKDWQFNLITVWSTGVPYTILNSNSVSNAVPGTADRPNVVGKMTVSNASVSRFFNTEAFASQTPGTYGNEGRYALHGPHFRHADMSLFKTFAATDLLKVEFRAECFNISNTANFAVPNANLGSPQFGQLTSMISSYTPREFQFALKLNF